MALQITPFNTATLDPLVHGQVRLGIMAYLASVESAKFTEVRDAVQTTDGNLSTHLKKLNAADYVEISKVFSESKPKTLLSLTPTGRAAWHKWVESVLALMKVAV